jgi:hypothetical protein
VYDDAFVTADQSTLIDFEVDAVAVAVTPVGVERTTDTDDTVTGVLELEVVPSPSCPYVPWPQHLTVVSTSTAHVCTYPAEI